MHPKKTALCYCNWSVTLQLSSELNIHPTINAHTTIKRNGLVTKHQLKDVKCEELTKMWFKCCHLLLLPQSQPGQLLSVWPFTSTCGPVCVRVCVVSPGSEAPWGSLTVRPRCRLSPADCWCLPGYPSPALHCCPARPPASLPPAVREPGGDGEAQEGRCGQTTVVLLIVQESTYR